MPEKVPLYVSVLPFTSYGSRLPQYPRVMRSDMEACHTCAEWMWERSDENWCGGNKYCNKCIEAAREEDRKKWESRTGWTRAVPRVDDTPRILSGNLEEYEYRFWIGDNLSQSLRSTCRACGEVCYGRDDRMRHKSRGKEIYTSDVSCLYVLTQCYKTLLYKRKCLVCGKETYGEKWGIPLCKDECLQTWKFDEHKSYPELELELMDWWKVDKRTSGSIILASS